MMIDDQCAKKPSSTPASTNFSNGIYNWAYLLKILKIQIQIISEIAKVLIGKVQKSKF